MKQLESVSHYDYFSEIFEIISGNNFHAGYFDHPNKTLEDATTSLTDLLAKKASITHQTKVLDIGCGIGGPAKHLARAYGAMITGICNSSGCINRAIKSPQENVTFKLIDAQEIHKLDELFNIIWILEASHLIANKQELFNNMYSTVVPGGKFILCDFFLTSSDKYSKELLYKMKGIFRAFGKLKLSGIDVYIAHAQSAGFDHIETQDISDQVTPTFTIWRERAESKIPNAEGYKRDMLINFSAASLLLFEFFRDGILTYKILTGKK